MVTYPYDGNTVSIHAPTGGATIAYETAATTCEFQFTRPRGARLTNALPPCDTLVSIHAPTGGATEVRDPTIPTVKVSIHAPTGGATSTVSLWL